MNSLEWINKQILLVKQNIQYHKDLLAESEEEYTDEIISAIKLLEPELQTLQQIKSELEVLQILTKCIRVSTISYDDNDISKNSYDYSLETDELTIEEFNTLDNYYKALEVEDE